MSPSRSTYAGSARLGIVLTVLLGVPVAVCFCLAAFDPAALAVPLVAGRPVSLWHACGLGLIGCSVLLAVLYVVLTNRQAAQIAGRGLGAAFLLALTGVAARAAGNAAGPAPAGGTEPSGTNRLAVGMVLVLATLAITWWAARRTRSARDVYAGGGRMGVLQNGPAIAGDPISAGAFLGLTGLVFGAGYNGLLFATGYCVGSPVIVPLFADKMRNMGRFTFADILASRLAKTPIRALAAMTTLTIVVMFLVAQMVGAGQLVQLLFGLDHTYAEVAVGGLMGGGNMAAVHLAHALAGASAVSHDLYASIVCRGMAEERAETRVSRLATVALGLAAVLLGIAFRTQAIACLITLAVGIPASTNFPPPLLAIYWHGLATMGALAGGLAGLVASVAMTLLGPALWVTVLGHPAPGIALDLPTIVTMPLAFATCIAVSLLDRSRQAVRDRDAFDSQHAPSGLLAEAAE